MSILETAPIRTEIVDDGATGIARAAALLCEGRLVAFPTETVYGLGGDATDDRAMAAIFEAKQRPSFNPLISHVAQAEQAEDLVVFDARARRVAETLWPGPLTLVLPRREGCPVSLLASAGLDSLAIRVPAHPGARKLLAAVGRPIAAPSANVSGAVSPTTPQHVLDGLSGRVSLVVAGGRCAVGLESTVLDLTGDQPILLRPGGVTVEDLTALLGPIALSEQDPNRPTSPGQLSSHYAPRAQVRLNAGAIGPDEVLLTFGPDLRSGPKVMNLSDKGNLTEAAANLFAMLRGLDKTGAGTIAVAPIPETGLGAAINDRLRRAAAPRP